MQRVLVLLLSALDALVAAAVGLAAALAPLTVLWFVAFGAGDLVGIWQTSATIWQFGHAVPVQISLPELYAAQLGVDETLATFTLSLAPLAFAGFTLLFAGHSGVRAGRAGAGWSGALAGILVFAGIAVGVAFTGQAPLAGVELWQAVLFPVAFYAVGITAGALRVAWTDGDDGAIDRLRARLDEARGAWPEVPELAVRGGATALTGLVAIGGLVLAAALILRGPQIVALSQSANLDAGGAAVFAVAQLLYLPTLLVWALAFIAGPGIGLGAGSVVSPAGTQVGIVPGIPVLGVLPEGTSPWLLLLALLPIAVGVFSGWTVRSRLRPRGAAADAETTGILLVLTAAIALAAALGGALLSVLASGAMGPGRLAAVGPDAAQVALALGVEVGLGAAIMLLSPRRSVDEDDRPGRGLGATEPPLLGRFSSSREEVRDEVRSSSRDSARDEAGTDTQDEPVDADAETAPHPWAPLRGPGGDAPAS